MSTKSKSIPLFIGGLQYYAYELNIHRDRFDKLLENTMSNIAHPTDVSCIHICRPNNNNPDNSRLEGKLPVVISCYRTDEPITIDMIDILLEEDSCWGLDTKYLILEGDIELDLYKPIRELSSKYDLTIIVMGKSPDKKGDRIKILENVNLYAESGYEGFKIIKQRGFKK